jgi:hypothetical protein
MTPLPTSFGSLRPSTTNQSHSPNILHRYITLGLPTRSTTRLWISPSATTASFGSYAYNCIIHPISHSPRSLYSSTKSFTIHRSFINHSLIHSTCLFCSFVHRPSLSARARIPHLAYSTLSISFGFCPSHGTCTRTALPRLASLGDDCGGGYNVHLWVPCANPYSLAGPCRVPTECTI